MHNIKIVRTNKRKTLSLLLLVIVCIILSFFIGYYKFEYDIYDARGGKNLLVKKLLITQKQLATINAEKYHLEQELQLEEKTTEELYVKIKEQHHQIDDIQSELILFKSIIDPESEDLGVVVHKFKLFRLTDIENNKIKFDPESLVLYRAEFIIINYAIDKKLMKGKGEIIFFDKSGSIYNSYQLFNDQFNPIGSKQVKIGFKYFQQSTFYILIDKTFDLFKLELSVKEHKNKFESINLEIESNDLKEFNYVGK